MWRAHDGQTGNMNEDDPKRVSCPECIGIRGYVYGEDARLMPFSCERCGRILAVVCGIIFYHFGAPVPFSSLAPRSTGEKS